MRKEGYVDRQSRMSTNIIFPKTAFCCDLAVPYPMQYARTSQHNISLLSKSKQGRTCYVFEGNVAGRLH